MKTKWHKLKIFQRPKIKRNLNFTSTYIWKPCWLLKYCVMLESPSQGISFEICSKIRPFCRYSSYKSVNRNILLNTLKLRISVKIISKFESYSPSSVEYFTIICASVMHKVRKLIMIMEWPLYRFLQNSKNI